MRAGAGAGRREGSLAPLNEWTAAECVGQKGNTGNRRGRLLTLVPLEE